MGQTENFYRLNESLYDILEERREFPSLPSVLLVDVGFSGVSILMRTEICTLI